jgi:hypothetical protein
MTPQSPIVPDPAADSAVVARRASARRTALVLGGIAFVVYLGFIVLNAVGQ